MNVEDLRGGFQVLVTLSRAGGGEYVEVLHNVPAASANQLLRRWQRPAWARWGGTVTLQWSDDDTVATYHWSDVREVRIQPEREVI